MKKLMIALLVAASAVFVRADEEITMLDKQITEVTVPFGIRSYTPSNKDVVRIEKTSDTSLRLTALKSGRCDLEVRGDMEMTTKFLITVGGALPGTLEALQQELETIPEVQARIIGDSIRVDGEIKSIKKWNNLRKVLQHYQGTVRNFAEFWPDEEILLRMKETLKQSGFDVSFSPLAGEPKTWKANTVALATSKVNRSMTVQARVYTPEQKAKIMECLKTQKFWLYINDDDKATFDEEQQVKANVQVFVAKPIVRLSVAYMAIGEEDIRKIGNRSAVTDEGPLHLTGVFDVLRDLVHGNNTRNTASIGASLGVATRFFAQNGISRISNTGYTLMESWDDNGAKFKSGGTRFVKVYGRDVAELKEIPYGFTINAKGGLMNDTDMSLDFDFGLSTIIPMDDETYDRKEDLSKQKFTLPIGRTTLVSGFKDLVDKNTPPSGIPFFRSTPILNWFVADSGKEVSDRRLVIMICPEIVDNTQDGTIKVGEEINIPVQDRASKTTDEVLEEKNDQHSGFWGWLDWFSF